MSEEAEIENFKLDFFSILLFFLEVCLFPTLEEFIVQCVFSLYGANIG